MKPLLPSGIPDLKLDDFIFESALLSEKGSSDYRNANASASVSEREREDEDEP